jgi:hypothetical protein
MEAPVCGAPAEVLALLRVTEPNIWEISWRSHNDRRWAALQRCKHGAQALCALVQCCLALFWPAVRPKEDVEGFRLACDEGAILHVLVLEVNLHSLLRSQNVEHFRDRSQWSLNHTDFPTCRSWEICKMCYFTVAQGTLGE